VELSGQRSSMVVPERSEIVNATFHFDQKLGCLIDINKTDKFTDSVNMMVQGNSATSHTDAETDTSIQLVAP
jgi:hypothetical protein